jgi:uncharacterized membrane protein YeiH
MDKMNPQSKIILAAILGAIGGGILVAVATKAIPRIMSGIRE